MPGVAASMMALGVFVVLKGRVTGRTGAALAGQEAAA
jgi:hypothetical protein